MKLFRYLVLLASIAGSLLAVVYIRTLNCQQYYQCRRNVVVIEKLKTGVEEKRIELERLTNPSSLKQAAESMEPEQEDAAR